MCERERGKKNKKQKENRTEFIIFSLCFSTYVCVWLLLLWYAPLIIHITQLEYGGCKYNHCVCYCSCLHTLGFVLDILYNILFSQFTFNIISFDILSKVLYIFAYDSNSVSISFSRRVTNWIRTHTHTRTYISIKLDTHFHPHSKILCVNEKKKYRLLNNRNTSSIFDHAMLFFFLFGRVLFSFHFISFCFVCFFAMAIGFLLVRFFSCTSWSSFVGGSFGHLIGHFYFFWFFFEFLPPHTTPHRWWTVAVVHFPYIYDVCYMYVCII